MAEAIAAISIAANIVQFVDFTAKILSASHRIKGSGFRDNDWMAIVVKDLQKVSSGLKSPLVQENGRFPTDNDMELLHLAKQCDEIASDLLTTLKSLEINVKNLADRSDVTRQKSKRVHVAWANFRTALKTVWKEDEIIQLEKRIESFRQQLILRILVSLRDEIKESQPAQAEPQNNVHILDKPALGVGEQFLGYIEESKRWQTDLINAIHQHSSTAGERSVETVTAIDLKRDERLWKQILERLRFAEMTDRRDRIVEAHNKTFRWIFDAPGSAENMATVWPSFSDWLRNGSGLYWIAGKAGSGKSTLMKYIYDNTRTVQLLQEWCGESDLTVASFYFWNSGVDMQMSEMGLLRSILLQLLTKHKEFIPRLFPGRWEAYVLFGNDPSSWSLRELRKALSLLSHEAPDATKFCFFVDGLDEFDGDHSELNDLFKTLASFSHIKVCVSSRPWNVFEDDFGVKSCLMLQDLTYQDIKLFVDSRFDEDHGFSELEIREPSYAAELKESVARKAEGVFLWVSLVVRSLLAGMVNGDRVCDLERRLDLLPPNLGDLYEKMLQSLDPFYYAHASQLFQMAHEASPPLSLLTYSFADEEPDFVFKCPVRCLTEKEQFLRLDVMRKRINSRCKGLLEVPRGYLDSHHDTTQSSEFQSGNFSNGRGKGPVKNMTVQYLHRTVKDFLARPDVWNSLLKASPLGFKPRLSICRGLVAQFKHMDPEILEHESFWTGIKSCIKYAKPYHDLTGNFVLLLKDLDNSASKLAESCREDGSSFLSRSFEKTMSTVEIKTPYPHWTSTFSGYKEDKGLTFLSLAVQLNLQYFVKAEVNRSCLVMQDSGLWPLLHDAVTYDKQLMEFFDIRWFPNPEMLKILLVRGANPNWTRRHDGTGSIFEHLLEIYTSAKSSNSIGASKTFHIIGRSVDEKAEAYGYCIKKFIEYGATSPKYSVECSPTRCEGALVKIVPKRSLIQSWFGPGKQ